MDCGHVFHFNCVKRLLEVRWNGPRITFGFCVCPICRASWVKCQAKPLKELLTPLAALYDEVRSKACLRLQYDGMADTVAGGEEEKATFAMSKYTYYPCFKCGKAYFGGDASCEAARGAAEFDPSELVCPTCVGGAAMQICPKHGTDFLEYKCRYCCSVAVFFCFGAWDGPNWRVSHSPFFHPSGRAVDVRFTFVSFFFLGTTHFCNTCHDDYQRCQNCPKDELPHCPVGCGALITDGRGNIGRVLVLAHSTSFLFVSLLFVNPSTRRVRG